MILVTGGTGTTGYFVICELLRRGIAVRAFTRLSSAKRLENLEIEIALGDLADIDSLGRAVEGVRGIIHTACTFKNAGIDQAAMSALLDAWKEGPFVFVSSVDVYGAPLYLPLDEIHPLNSTGTDYGDGKVRCEALLRTKAEQCGRTDWSILRPPHIWGPHHSCAKKIVQQYQKIWAGEAVPLASPTAKHKLPLGDGWIDARELGWVAAECLERPLTEAANIVNSHFTWEELYQELIQLTGSMSIIEPSSDVTGIYAVAWQYDGSRLVEHLGFQPKYNWRDTLAEAVSLLMLSS
ncbi:MAG: NAD(P)-dependent oxidoreductase [Leptolyngbyaceae cyanobacterium MO_188.B28]|nr:NAD(P)-dependent oxidoreductase [Leptolyngbyaceae cyanobacterium MO_188.B28]